MDKLSAALKYAAKGWKIFPLAPNTKIPMAGISHGVKDATTDAETIRQWWTLNPEANIGLACGTDSNVWVVDIDVRPEKGIDGFQSIKESGKKLTRTLCQQTPSGGMHCLYACTNNPPANKNGFITGVDIRGTGYYIVLAPSTIDGKVYHFLDDTTPLAEFPDDFKPVKVETKSVFTAIPSLCTVPQTSASERARAYLEKIPGAIEHVDGHAKLFWVAQVLVNGFRLSDHEALQMMWNEYNPKCSPPWVRNAKTEKEFRHKVNEARAKPNPEAVAIYDAVQDNAWEANFDIDACIADVQSPLLRQTVKAHTTETATPLTKKEAGLNDLLIPDGLIGETAAWISETAGCYQPLFALGASLTMWGALFGRKVCDESNGRTNIFCMGVGHSSCGKDHPGDCINKILAQAGAQNILMGRMTSDAALEKALSLSPTKLAIMDEVGHFFSNINKAGEGASYLKTIKPTMMELFSSAHKAYIGKEKASGRAVIIDQPCMCVWGVTAPQKLYDGMTIEELQDGWIARNLIFISDTRPSYVMKPTAEIPESIINAAKSWYERGPAQDALISSAGMVIKPIVVPMTQEARITFDAYSRSAHDHMLEASRRGDKTEYLWGKAFQNARRIALIIACGREYENPVIGEYEAAYGCHLVELLVRNTAEAIARNVSENAWEKDKNRIYNCVVMAGHKGITQAELTRKTQWLKGQRERNQYLADLQEGGKIARVTDIFGKSKWVTSEIAHQHYAEQNTEVEHDDANA